MHIRINYFMIINVKKILLYQKKTIFHCANYIIINI